MRVFYFVKFTFLCFVAKGARRRLIFGQLGWHRDARAAPVLNLLGRKRREALYLSRGSGPANRLQGPVTTLAAQIASEFIGQASP